MNAFDKLVPLSHRVEVYVPSTYNVNEQIDNTQYVNDVLTRLSNWFGGATASEASGAWMSNRGLVNEKVTICFSFIGNDDFTDLNLNKVHDMAAELKKTMKQEAITCVIDGVCYFA